MDENFWKNNSQAKKIIKEKTNFENILNSYKNSLNEINDLKELHNLALEEKNQNVQKEIIKNINDLRVLVKKNEIKCFLSNEADFLNCYIEIHAGAGGTESQDWADMLRKMYLKWSDNKSFKSSLINEHKGE